MASTNTITLKLEVDHTGAVRGVSEFVNTSVKGNQQLQKETGKLTGFINEQRAENRKQNFLINESRSSIGALSLAVTGFGLTGTGAMKKVTDGIGQALNAFTGFDFALATLGVGGPMGLAIAGVAALTTTLIPLIAQNDAATRSLKTHSQAATDLATAYENATDKIENRNLAKSIAEDSNKHLLKRKADHQSFLNDLQNGVKVEERVLGQRVQMTVTGERAMEILRLRGGEAFLVFRAARDKALAEGKDLDEATIEATKEVQAALDELNLRYDANLATIREVNSQRDKLPEETKPIIETEAELQKQLAAVEEQLKRTNVSEYDRNRLLERRREIFAKLEQDKPMYGPAVPPVEEFIGPIFTPQMAADEAEREARELNERLRADAELTGDVYQSVTSSIGFGLTSMFEGKEGAGKDFFKSLAGNFITLAETALLSAKAGALGKGVFSFGATLLADLPSIALGFALLEGARGLINAFALGGLVTKPTLALIGEAGEPEIVAPARTFRQIMDQDIVPGIYNQVRLMMRPPTTVTLAGGGSADAVVGELRELRRTLNGKDWSPRISGLVDGQTLVKRNLNGVERNLRETKR